MKSFRDKLAWKIAMMICKDREYAKLSDYLKAKWGTWKIGEIIVGKLPEDENELKIVIEALKYMNINKVAKMELYKRLKDYGII